MPRFLMIAAVVALAACTQQAANVPATPSAPTAAALDIATLPMPNERPRAEIAADYASVSNKSAYTLAMSGDGHWGSQARTGNRTPEDRRRNALQKCEHAAGAPCGLVVDNGVAVARFSPMPSGLVYGGRFDAASAPFVSAASRAEMATEYALRAGDRALAIHRNGAWGYEWGKAGAQAAIDGALRRCAEFSESADCFIHDVNGQVRFNRDTPLRNPG